MNKYMILLVISALIASVAQIFLKKSSMKQYDSVIREYLNIRVVAGYGLMVLSTVLTILAFTRVDYKYGPILEATGYIFMLILGNLFLKEAITKKKLIGNALILLGIIVFSI